MRQKLIEYNKRTALTKIEEGDKIIAGTKCSHIFHTSCSLAWMKKGNYDCPCCRKVRVDAVQLRQVAKEELGKERMDELARLYHAIMTGTLPQK